FGRVSAAGEQTRARLDGAPDPRRRVGFRQRLSVSVDTGAAGSRIDGRRSLRAESSPALELYSVSEPAFGEAASADRPRESAVGGRIFARAVALHRATDRRAEDSRHWYLQRGGTGLERRLAQHRAIFGAPRCQRSPEIGATRTAGDRPAAPTYVRSRRQRGPAFLHAALRLDSRQSVFRRGNAQVARGIGNACQTQRALDGLGDADDSVAIHDSRRGEGAPRSALRKRADGGEPGGGHWNPRPIRHAGQRLRIARSKH